MTSIGSAISVSMAALAFVISASCAHAEPDDSPNEAGVTQALESFVGLYDVSEAALRTAILGDDGAPVGLAAYEDPSAAVRAGDTAAFIAAIKTGAFGAETPSPFEGVIVSLDLAAGNDLAAALDLVRTIKDESRYGRMAGLLEAWYLALDGQSEEAIRVHRSVSQLPGMSGDLSLAAMLDAMGRRDEALAVYASLTPSKIIVPEHDFDPQGIVYNHTRLVIARQAILLRREGRIDEAIDLYRRLAEADPESGVAMDAVIYTLQTGEGLDDKPLTLNAAFARVLNDYASAISLQTLFANVMMGNRVRGYDDSRGAIGQIALLFAPDEDDLRLSIVDDLYDEALFDGALHVLRVAPEPSANLAMMQASVLLRQGDREGTSASLKQATALAKEDEKLSVTSRAMRLHALLKNESEALDLAAILPDLADTAGERASANSSASGVYAQFARYDEALAAARRAVALDNSHERRMALTSALADAGEIEEGLSILRDEALARPNDPYMLNSLGYYLVLHTDRLDEAFKVLARAHAMAETDPYIADSYGWVRFKMGDLDGARRYIELSQRELAPNKHWEIEDHLGDVYWHLGRKDDALKAWQTALEEFPPQSDRARIQYKVDNGISEPAPPKRPLPDVSLGDDPEAVQRDI
ncbi:MAG: tetratricopeptide repeat protein [Pseudomonadota bacterium]